MTPSEIKTINAIAERVTAEANKMAAEMAVHLMTINGAIDALKAENKALKEENARLWGLLGSRQVSLRKNS